MPTCLNLRETYGDKYRVAYEESYYAEHGSGSRADDPWLQIIPCQHGHIGPFCTNRLFASTDRRGPTARALRALDCCEVWMDGDDGLSVMFAPADFKRVAAVMKPKRKRQLSPERRAALIEAGKSNRFLPARHGVNASPNERQRVPMASHVQSHQATEGGHGQI